MNKELIFIGPNHVSTHQSSDPGILLLIMLLSVLPKAHEPCQENLV